MKIISDQPLSTAELFNFDTYAETIARTIVRKDTETPLVIGIFGDWGSGKTSLMKTIENIAENKFIFRDDLVNQISLVNKLRDSQDQISRSIKEGFSPNTNILLEKYDDSAPPSEELQKALVDELNKLVKNPYHFDKQKKLIKKDNLPFSKEDLIHFKLSELIKVYSEEIDIPTITVKTVWFNAWKYDKKDVLWRALLMRILEELKTQKKEEKEKFLPRSRIDKLKLRYLKLRWMLNHKLNPFLFHVANLENRSLEAKLCDSQNQLSQYLIDNSNLTEILENYDILETPREEMNIKLENEINKFLLDNNLFVNIPSVRENSSNLMKILIQSQPKGDKLKFLNKSLLEETYLEEEPDKIIEDLQTSLYRDVYREEYGDLEFKPGKAIKGTIKLGLSAVPLINDPTKELLKNIDDHYSLDDLLESVQKKKKVECIEQVQFMEQFEQKFEDIIDRYYNKNGKRVVIFIDDLDRCLPEKALEVLEAIKLFLDVKGCIFILGIDRRVINYIVRKKYEELIEIRKEGEKEENHVVEKERREDIRISGENYLEKIIQLSFYLPPLTDNNIEDLIFDLVRKSYILDFYADPPYIYMIIKGIENNPRKIKRFFNVIELQRNLAASNKEIQEKIAADEKTEKRFDALLLEWAIISYSYENFQNIVKENNWILLEIHKILLENPDYDICESTLENLQNLKWDSKECKQISELVKAFNKGIGEIPYLEEIEFVIYLSSVTPIEMPFILEGLRKRERLGRNEVINRKSSKESLRWKDISGVDLSEIDLSGLDFSYSNFHNATLNDVNFNNAILTEANLFGAKLHRTNLKKADLSKAKLMSADLESAILIGAKMNGSIIKNTMMSKVNMSSADLSGADMYNVVFNDSSMEKTQLTKARLVSCNFRNAKFDSETNFKGADIDWITIKNLVDSNWTIAQWDPDVLDRIKKKSGEE